MQVYLINNMRSCFIDSVLKDINCSNNWFMSKIAFIVLIFLFNNVDIYHLYITHEKVS